MLCLPPEKTFLFHPLKTNAKNMEHILHKLQQLFLRLKYSQNKF